MQAKNIHTLILLFVISSVLIACSQPLAEATVNTPTTDPTLIPTATVPPSPTQTPAPTFTPTPNIITTASGLQYEDIIIGTGDEVQPGMILAVHYIGWLEDGTTIDNSYDSEIPFEFPLGAGYVIPGWDEGLVGMRVGGKRKLIIPPELGYGKEGIPNIFPANAVMIFEIELLEVRIPTPTPLPIDQILVSPNEAFVAKKYNELNHPSGKPVIEIEDAYGKLLWSIPYQGEVPTYIPRPNLAIYGWSFDSTKLYFYYNTSSDGGKTLWNGYHLQSIDIETGNVEKVIQTEGDVVAPFTNDELIVFSFSSDKQQLIYSKAEDALRRLYLRDMLTGNEQSLDIPYPADADPQIGWIYWAPDEKALVFHGYADSWIWVFHLDLETLTLTPVWDYRVEDHWFDGWSANGNLRFTTYTTFPDFEIVEFNIESGEFTTLGTPTPTP